MNRHRRRNSSQAKLAERDERHAKAGESRYLVEPNVKDGKGGLRDLQTLFWIGKYFYRVRTGDELVDKGVFTRAEYSQFLKAEDFLWAVRCHMHFLTGKAEERLHFDIQREIAERLGYTSHPGLSAVERFMKHYFLVAKDVGDLTRIFCAALEEEQAKHVPGFNRIFLTFSRRKRKLAGTSDFIVDNHRINIADDQVFERDPVNLLRLFWFADMHGLEFHPDALKLLTRSLGLVDTDAAPRRGSQPAVPRHPDVGPQSGAQSAAHERGRAARQADPGFRQDRRDDAVLHVSPLYGGRASAALHRRAVRDRAWRRREGAPAGAHADARAEEEPRGALCRACSCTTSPRAGRRTIPKPAPGSRGASARIWACRRPTPRPSPGWSRTICLMSMTAQTRDLNDRKTIDDFASIVQSVERLKLLLVLTVCDIRGVGPGVWNGWKGQLLRTLYYETELLLDRRLLGSLARAARRGRARKAGRGAGRLAGEGAQATMSSCTTRTTCWRSTWTTSFATPNSSARRMRRSRQLATMVKTHEFEAVTEITVLAHDHPRLLSVIAGACAAAGGNIVDAQIFTTADGRALDTILITREFDRDEDELRRADRVGRLIEDVLSGKSWLPEMIAKRTKPKRGAQDVHASSRAPTSATRCRTASRSSRSRASTGRACCRRSPGRCPTCRSTSPRRTSPPSARRSSTPSTSPT